MNLVKVLLSFLILTFSPHRGLSTEEKDLKIRTLIHQVLSRFWKPLETDPEKQRARRDFLKGSGAAGFSILSGAAGSVLAAMNRKYFLRLLARARLRTLNKGLEGYKKEIQRIWANLPEELRPHAKASIMRVNRAQTAAMEAEQIYQDYRHRAAEHSHRRQRALEDIRVGQTKADTIDHDYVRLKKLKKKFRDSFDEMHPEVRLMMVRELLNVRLLNRIEWQIKSGEDVILTASDKFFLDEYRFLMRQVKDAPLEKSTPFVKELATRYFYEAEAARHAFNSATRVQANPSVLLLAPLPPVSKKLAPFQGPALCKDFL